MKDDGAIEQLILQRFMGKGKLDIKRIGAESKEGIVILRGQASSLGEIELAQELAAQVEGVEEVRSLLKYTKDVKDFNDISITESVELALGLSEIVNVENIMINCFQGIITLEGIVDDREQKNMAQVIAKTVPGVVKVIDNLESLLDNQDNDGYLTIKLRRALLEDRRIDSTQVKGYVNKKIAYLNGKVYSINAKKAAEEVVQKNLGFKDMVNNIVVAYQ